MFRFEIVHKRMHTRRTRTPLVVVNRHLSPFCTFLNTRFLREAEGRGVTPGGDRYRFPASVNSTLPRPSSRVNYTQEKDQNVWWAVCHLEEAASIPF